MKCLYCPISLIQSYKRETLKGTWVKKVLTVLEMDIGNTCQVFCSVEILVCMCVCLNSKVDCGTKMASSIQMTSIFKTIYIYKTVYSIYLF